MQGLHAKDAFATHVEKTEDDDREGPHPLSEVRAMIADAIERHRPSGNFGEMDSYRLFGRPDTGITEARFLRTIWRWNLPCSRSQLREIFRVADLNESGTLSLDEFFYWSLTLSNLQTGNTSAAESAFKKFDSDGTGKLN